MPSPPSDGGVAYPAKGSTKGRVLIVEDEMLVALCLAELLEQFGYETCPPVASGAAALELAASESPDLALIDFHLAGDMDGVDTATKLLAQYGVPALFLSGTSDPALIARAVAAGARGFLRKPFAPREIERAIAEAFAAGS